MYRVLIVDDDKLARKGLISIVPWEECGLTVVGDVSNGMIALEFLKSHEVDLVVVDLSMPVLSGLDFIRESQKSWPELQYVVLSFHESFEYVQSALRLGAVDYLSKLRLEQEDCAEVFTRVAKLLETRLGELKQADTMLQLEIDPEQLEKLQAEWDSLFWVYDDTVFEGLKQRTADSGITVRQLEHLLVRTLQYVSQTFGADARIDLWNCVEEGLEWVSGFRETLHAQSRETADCSQLPFCMLRAVCYIRTHLKSDQIRSETIAEQVNMSRGYFSTNFKKLVGQTFNDFVRTARVQHAKELLQQKRMSIAELAEAVGYEDSKYFAHVFLEQTGVSCSEYSRRFSTLREQRAEFLGEE